MASHSRSGATSDEIETSVAAITETTKRGAALVEQLLTVSRKAETQIALTDINKLIQRLSDLIKGTFPKSVETSVNLAAGLPAIMADTNQITQVLLNLCVNARDAMPDGGKLVLRLRWLTEQPWRDMMTCKQKSSFASKSSIAARGWTESVRSKIFDPFFTTKPSGQGTGLGLAVAYGIVKSHDGFIEFESEPNRGTTFRLYFPVVFS